MQPLVPFSVCHPHPSFAFLYPRPVFVLALFLWPLQWSVATAELLVLTQLRCITDSYSCLLPGSRLCLQSGVVLFFFSEADARITSHTYIGFEPKCTKTWHVLSRQLPCAQLSTIISRAGSMLGQRWSVRKTKCHSFPFRFLKRLVRIASFWW